VITIGMEAGILVEGNEVRCVGRAEDVATVTAVVAAHQRWEENRSDRLNKIQNTIDAQQIGISGADSEGGSGHPGRGERGEVCGTRRRRGHSDGSGGGAGRGQMRWEENRSDRLNKIQNTIDAQQIGISGADPEGMNSSSPAGHSKGNMAMRLESAPIPVTRNGGSDLGLNLCWSAHQRWEENRSDRLNKIQNTIDAQQIGISGK
jgi:hypothetical protein